MSQDGQRREPGVLGGVPAGEPRMPPWAEQGRGGSQVMPTTQRAESVAPNVSLMGDVLVRDREEWNRG